MGLLPGIFAALVHALVVVLDLALLFLVARVASRRCNNRLIRGLDRAGEVFVDEVTARVNNGWLRLFPRRSLSDTGRINLALLVLASVRCLITLFLVAVL